MGSAPSAAKASAPHGVSPNALPLDAKHAARLALKIERCMAELAKVPVAVSVADALAPDCPVVAVSPGFAALHTETLGRPLLGWDAGLQQRGRSFADSCT